MQTDKSFQSNLSVPIQADNPASINAFADELVALGRAQAKLLGDYQREILLSYFNDRRIVRGDIYQMQECARWIPRGGTVMDWACGPALPSLILRKLRPDLILKAANFDTDIQSYQLMWDAAGLQVERLEHDWKLPWPDKSLDVVISKGVIEHVPLEQFSLAEIFRVLRHNGKLIITGLPARYSLLECFNRTLGRLHHPRLYTLGGSKKLLLSSGFHIAWSGFRCSCPLSIPWAEPIFRLWERVPIARHLTQNIVLVGAKSAHGVGDQNYARHNLKATLKRIEAGEKVSD